MQRSTATAHQHILTAVQTAASAVSLVAQTTDARRREPRPQWRFATSISQNNVWHLRTMDYEESARNYPGNTCPQDRMRYSDDNRDFYITLTSVADLDNFVQPFLTECGHQIEPEQKQRIDDKISALRQTLSAVAVPQVPTGSRFQMLHSWHRAAQAAQPLTYQQRAENIMAHPQFNAMVNRMLLDQRLPRAANQPAENTQAQFHEHIAQWLDPVSHDLMQNPVALPEEEVGKPRVLVDRATYNSIMALPEPAQRRNPVTTAPIPQGYSPPAVPNVEQNIQAFLRTCEQELQILDRQAHHSLRFFW